VGPTPASRPQRFGIVGGCGVVEPELAGFRGEPIQDSPTFRATAVLEVDEVLETDSTVAVRLLEGDGAVFEELDEGGAADPEEIGCLLGGEEQALGGDKGGLPLTHDVDDLAQDAVDLGRKWDLLAVRAEKQAWLGVALEETGKLEELVEVLGREDNVLVTPVVDGGGRWSPGSSVGRRHEFHDSKSRKKRKLPPRRPHRGLGRPCQASIIATASDPEQALR